MTRDTFDAFTPPERGRFGDNESRPRSGKGPRVTGASDLLDLTLVLHHQTEKALLVSADGNEKRAAWLPKSQIEFVPTGTYVEGVKKVDGLPKKFVVVAVTLPDWLAAQKGLI